MSLRTPEAAVSISTISASEFGNLCRIRGEIELIDVRTPAEYREAHLEIARNLFGRVDSTACVHYLLSIAARFSWPGYGR
jgi:hypothetical protein